MPLKLTPPQAAAVHSLAREHCCNCDDGICLLMDAPCAQIRSRKLVCRYFNRAVLPAAPKLHQTILSQITEE